MGKYIKVFNNHNNYYNHIMSGQAASPNVSYCMNEKEVHYNPEIFASEYFTTIARENGTISFNIRFDMGTEYINSISYSTDNGETWNTTNNTNSKSENLVINVGVNEGDKVMWKGDATQLGYYDENEGCAFGSFFSSTCEIDVQGNVMSLLYGDKFKGETTIENEYALSYLFIDYNSDDAVCLIVNAKNMSLPATTLANGCYKSMFGNCTSLTTAPILPATTLADNCYRDMFYGCTSLTIAPQLPATTLAEYCYANMFDACASLIVAPELPATILVEYCYFEMFVNCTNLTMPPVLSATSLTTVCYGRMFGNCTSLTAPPALPATTLAHGCYYQMFEDCTSLTTAPSLPATTLANKCYQYMFNGCTNLNSITCLATNISATDCTKNWVNGVAASGTFTKASSMNSWTIGANGIPTGWTVQTDSN